jgi:hypothetical protein
MIFEKGKKFRYCFALTEQKFWNDKFGRIQEVRYIITIGGVKVVESKFLEDNHSHRFDLESDYAKCCAELDEKMDSGLPYFWDE